MNTNPKIVIVDYGLSNLYSISKALQRFSDNVVITDELSVLETADAVVLPGVGAFAEGMKGLAARGLVKGIQEFVKSGKPLLGICLGAQLLLSQGCEFGVFNGMDIIEGDVIKFPEIKNSKIPHVGWNKIYAASAEWSQTILDGISQNVNMYFVHSYILKPKNKENIFALTQYGDFEFCSIFRKDNIYGCQFHPEKSGEMGLQILKNFISIVKNFK